MSGLPAGAVTFLFSDIEGSTRLVKALRERYSQVIAEYRRLVRAAIAAHGGREVDTQGDGFFVAFGGATQAVLCALDIQRALAAHRWTGGAQVRVRIGIHTGHEEEGELTPKEFEAFIQNLFAKMGFRHQAVPGQRGRRYRGRLAARNGGSRAVAAASGYGIA